MAEPRLTTTATSVVLAAAGLVTLWTAVDGIRAALADAWIPSPVLFATQLAALTVAGAVAVTVAACRVWRMVTGEADRG